MEAAPATAPGPGLLQRAHTAGPGELKRSTSNSSFQRSPSYHQHQSRSRRGTSGGGSGGGKPTLEIYRPPNVRVDGSYTNGESSVSNRLNVHAKEFTMNATDHIKMSKSSGNILAFNNHNNNNNNNNVNKSAKSAMLQQSKSSGNIMHALQQQRHSQHQQASMGNALQQSHRVHFRFDVDGNAAEAGGAKGLHAGLHAGLGPLESLAASNASGRTRHRDHAPHAPHASGEDHHMGKPLRSKTQAAMVSAPPGGGIKRSKSLGSADILSGGQAKDLPDFANFPPEVQAAIHRAVEDPNQVSARTLMQLVRHIMDRVVESRSFAESAAKLCITIIEKEKNETFLESLLNTCQLWYQNREKYLKASSPSAGSSGSPSMRYPAFMAFLTEMYCQLKRRQLQLKTQYDGVPPGLLLLTLLAKCCQECLKPPSINSLKEMECLFFVLSSIGKDLEIELPSRMNAVLAGVRDAFLTSAAIPAIRKTLLQLIELHAAQWQLPAPAIMYYYPATNK